MAKDAQAILQDVLATFAVLLEEYFEGIDPFQINWKGETKEFANGNIEKFGEVMVDCHLFYQVEIDYDAFTEFEKFPTLEHAYTHIADKVLVKEGFDPKTLQPSR